MRLRRLKALAVKEVLQIWRDPRSLMIALLLPFTQMFLFGYGVNLDLKHLPICTFDREGSQASQDLFKHFQASLYFAIAHNVKTYPEMVAAIDRGDCRAGIVVPPDFSERLNDAGTASVQAILDGTDDNTANIAFAYAAAVVSGYSNDIQLSWLDRQGRTLQQVTPLVVQSRVWFNEDLVSRNFIIPGLVAVIMAMVGAQLTSLTIAREWERGTMEQLISTPVSAMEIMLGKLAPYFVLGMFDVMVCAVIAIYWFHVPFRGSYVTLFVCSAMFLVVVLSLGFFISVLAKSQFAACQIALLVTFLPAFLLSGFLFSIEQMPVALQWITRVIPARYYVSVLKKIFLKGTPTDLLAADLVPLAVFAFLLAMVATRSFHKRLT